MARGILAYAPSRFIEPALALVTLPILTRVLGAADYGDFQTIILAAGVLRILLFDWVNNCALRFHKPMESDLASYRTNLAAGLMIGTVASLPMAALAIWLMPGSEHSRLALLGWLTVTVIADGLARNQEMTLRAMQRPGAFSALRAGLSLARHGLGLACLLLFSRDITAYFAGWAAGTIVLCLWACRTTGAFRGVRIAIVRRDRLVEFARFGLPLGVVLLTTAVQGTGMRYVLQYLAGSEATGLFSAAYNLGSAPITVFQSVVMLGLYPLAINAFERDGRIDGVVRDGLRYFALLAIPVTTLVVILAEPVMSLLAGVEFTAAAQSLVILAVGGFLFGLSQYFSLGFLIAKRTGRWAAIQATAAALNLGLAAALVPRYGIDGAALATALAQGLTLAGSLTSGMGLGARAVPARTFAYSVLSCLPMIAMSWAARNWLAIGSLETVSLVALAGGALFVGFLLMTGELSREWNAACEALRFRRRARTEG